MAPQARSKGMPFWASLAEGIRAGLKGSSSVTMNRRAGAAEFADWADANHIVLGDGKDDAENVVREFTKTLDVHKRRNGELNKQGEACIVMAAELCKLAKNPVQKVETTWAAAVADVAAKMKGPKKKQPAPTAPEPALTVAAPPPEPVTPTEEPMAQRNEEPEDDLNDAAEDPGEVEEQEQEEEGGAEEDAPPRRRAARPPPVRIQYVQAPRAARPAARVAAPRSSAIKAIMPRPEKIRLYKRNAIGKRELIEDFTVDEIGDMKLEQFIREYIDPQYANDGVDTEYIAYELDPRNGAEKSPASTITIHATPQQESQDPFSNARKAMGLVQEMQGMMAPVVQPQTSPIIEDAKRKAAAGGDMQGMFMLMMMERMQQSQAPSNNGQTELIMKVLDRMDRLERGGGPSRDAGPSFGPPQGFGGFAPPPFQFVPPPPPVATGSDKLLDLAMAKLAQPPPSLADSIKDLMALQTLMQPKNGDNAEVTALKVQVAQLAAGGARAPAGSLEAGMETFEKMLTMQKAVATQVGGGSDVGGFFKSLISPEVGKAIAGIVQQAQANKAPPAPVAAAPAAPPPPRDYNRPPVPLPQAVNDAEKMFLLAQTSDVQVTRFVDLLQAMWLSGDPYYQKLLTPALEALNKAEESVQFLNEPRKLATLLVHEIRPQLASPAFVDACLAAMAMRAGVERLPATLTSTQGKWTFNGQDIILQDTVATPIPLTQPLHPAVASGAVPAAVPSQSREEREKELGIVREQVAVAVVEQVAVAAPVAVEPVVVPASEQVIEAPVAHVEVIEPPMVRELVPVHAESSPSA